MIEYKQMCKDINSSIEKSSMHKELEMELFLGAPNIRRLFDFIQKFSGNMFDNYNSLFQNRTKAKIIPTGTCTPFSKKMFITVSGKILQCEKISHDYFLGRVTEKKVELDFEHVAKMTNDYNFRFIEQCKTCAYFKSCIQCVFQAESFNSASPVCDNYISHELFQKIKYEILDYLARNPHLYKRILKEVYMSN